MKITGPFDVKTIPQPDAPVGRMLLDKQYHGDLEGTGKGQMLAFMTETPGSGAYVAVEQIDATLDGRRGTFVIHHTGIMTRGQPQLSIAVVPDSGTGGLKGITGVMDIEITGGRHFYTFEYMLPGQSFTA